MLVALAPGGVILTSGGFAQVRLDDGASVPLPSLEGADTAVRIARWDARGPRAIVDTAPDLSILDLSSGRRERFASRRDGPRSFALSADGNGIFYATNRCVESPTILSCSNLEFLLHLAARGAPERIVARGYTANRPSALVGFGSPEPSPSGDRIVFVFGTQLIAKPL